MAAGGPRLKASDREGTETSVHIMRAKAMLSLVSSRSPYRVSLNSAKGLARHPDPPDAPVGRQKNIAINVVTPRLAF